MKNQGQKYFQAKIQQCLTLIEETSDRMRELELPIFTPVFPDQPGRIYARNIYNRGLEISFKELKEYLNDLRAMIYVFNNSLKCCEELQEDTNKGEEE